MHTFCLVLTSDLLEDRRFDDVIIKTFFFPYILILYYIKQIDSKLPCVCSVIDQTTKCGKLRLACHFLVLTTFWRRLWSITLQTHGNLEMYLLIIYCKILRHYFSRYIN